MTNSLYIFIAALLLYSCEGGKKESAEVYTTADTTKTTEQFSPKTQSQKGAIRNDSILPQSTTIRQQVRRSDTLVIDRQVALFISPTVSRIEQMKRKYGGEDFYTAADDNLFYQSEARSFLEKRKIIVIFPKERYIKFVTTKGPNYVDTEHPDSSAWTIYLFHPTKAPAPINSIDIGEEYEYYFHNKPVPKE